MTLPEGWAETTLGDCQSRTSTVDPRSFPEEVFDLFSVPSYSAYTPEIVAGRDIGSTKQAVQADDLLLCKIVPHIRRGWVVPEADGRRQIGSGEWIVFRDHGLEPQFLRRFVLSDGFHDQFMQTTAGVGGSLTRARPAEAATIKVAVPPLAEQRRIVAKLDALTARLARARAELERVLNLVGRLRGPYATLRIGNELTSYGGRPSGDLIRWSSGKFLPKKSQRPGEIPVYGGNGVNGWHDEANVQSPTLVVGRVGAQCGNVHITPDAAWITDNAIFAKQISDQIDLAFALHVFRSANLIQEAAGTGQPYVNQEALCKVEYPLIDVPRQREIASDINATFARADRLEAEATRARALLDRLESALLAKAFRGELVPQDPSDEPAQTLLDRIRTGRAAAPKAKRGRRKKSGGDA